MRLSHAEAQALVSARQDGPLDPVAERELNAHLATCDSCRAFNGSATQLARGLQSLPYLPASPAVTRAVLDKVSEPRSGWSRFVGSMPENAMPVATAIAAAVIIVFVGAFAVFQNLNDDDPESLPALTQEPQGVAQQPNGTDEPETEPAGAGATEDPGGAAMETAFQTEEPAGREQTEEPAATEETLPIETEATGTGPETASTEEPAGQTEASGFTEEPDGDDGSGETATEQSNTLALEGATETPGDEQSTGETVAPTEETVPEETSAPTEEPVQPTEDPATEDVNSRSGGETEVSSTSAPDELLIGPSGQSTSSVEETTEPTATEEPTATLEPTATTEPTPEPTATLEPTATTEPTATSEPTPTATLEPTATAEPTVTPEPTATLEPTATTEPTPEPTATSEPTATTEPSPTPTEESTSTIVPIVGRDDTPESEVATEEQATEPTDGTGAASTQDPGQDEGDDGDETPLIEPSGNTAEASDDGDGQEGADDVADDGAEAIDDGEGDDDEQIIEPPDGSDDGDATDDGGDVTIDGSPVDDTSDDGDSSDDGSSDDGGDQPDGTGSASVTLGSAPVYSGLGDVPGNPEQRLGLSPDGSLVFSVNPGRGSLENNGITVTGQDSPGGQAVYACDAAGTCVDLSSASRGDGGSTDTPIGWLNGEVIYERMNGDDYAVEFRAVAVDPGTLEPGQDRSLGGGDGDWETVLRPYPVDGGLLVPTYSSWILITPEAASAIDGNAYGGDLFQIRITPATGIISYVVNGELILASLQAPGTPIATLPFGGGDYDFSPNGDQVAILTDEELRILDLNGTLLVSYPNPEGVNVGSLTWLNQGIVYVDFTGNVIRVIQP